jgi:DNA polymerase-3 subunit alpha
MKKELTIDETNLIKVEKHLAIKGFNKEEERETLELFSGIGNKEERVKTLSALEQSDDSEYVENIVSKINLVIPEKENVLPKFPTKNNKSSNDYLEELLKKALKEYLEANKELNKNVYLERLIYEFNVIKDMGYQDYFLIV